MELIDNLDEVQTWVRNISAVAWVLATLGIP